MKTKKIVSAILSAVMLVSMLPAAFAADASKAVTDQADPISEFAGRSMVCQVFTEEGGEITSRLVTVDIPRGTTASREKTLVDEAVFGAATRGMSGTVDILSTTHNFYVTNSETYCGGGTALQNYARLRVDMSFNTPPDDWFSVRCENDTTGVNSGWKNLEISGYAHRVIFYSSDVTLSANDSFSVYAMVHTSAPNYVTTCTIQGATF